MFFNFLDRLRKICRWRNDFKQVNIVTDLLDEIQFISISSSCDRCGYCIVGKGNDHFFSLHWQFLVIIEEGFVFQYVIDMVSDRADRLWNFYIHFKFLPTDVISE